MVSRAKEENVAQKDIGEIVLWSSLQLLDSPYVGGLLDKTTPEYLYISLSDTDCMLFVEQVAVLSRLIKANKLTFDNYVDGIKQIRYHGELSYCNRNQLRSVPGDHLLHYTADSTDSEVSQRERRAGRRRCRHVHRVRLMNRVL